MRSERGYVGMRVLAGMGVVALLVWVVPMVFLAREHATTVTGAVEDAGSGAGGSVAAPGPGPIGQASDLQAQSLLNSAIRAAQIWYAENGSYENFGPPEAASFAPSVRFTSGPPSQGTVSMRVTPDSVVMVTAADGAAYLCAATSLEIVSFGRTDASAPAQCQSGW